MKISSVPAGEATFSRFTVKLNGVETAPYFARVSAMPFNTVWPGHQRDISQTEEAGFVSFTLTEPVDVELTAAADFEEVTVRPLSKKVEVQTRRRTISFTLKEAGQYSVEVDGLHNPLYLFADPETDFDVDPEDENVIRFGPGVHDAGCIELNSHQTLFIQRGAVVYGWVKAICAQDIRIVGHGILDNSREIRTSEVLLVPFDIARRNTAHDQYSPFLKDLNTVSNEEPRGTSILKDKAQFETYLKESRMGHTPIQLYNCKNAEVSGIILRDSAGFTVTAANCENLICDNLKLVGMWRYNSDGIDLFNSTNCVIRNCFLRNFDDSVVLKGIPGWDEKNMQNILVENCVVWNDWGRALEIGAETLADEYSNIIFRNCDVIHVDSVALDIQNCDRAHVHDVLYENINVEFSRHDEANTYQHSEDQVYVRRHGEASLITACFGGSTYNSCVKRKGWISHLTYRNINVYTDIEGFKPKIELEDFDEEHRITDVRIEGIYINGNEYNVQ